VNNSLVALVPVSYCEAVNDGARTLQIVKHFRDPALRFDNLVYAYGQMGYLSAAVKGFLKRPKSDLPLSNFTTGNNYLNNTC
jgi:hypothetical protein